MKYVVSLTSRAEQDWLRAFDWYSEHYSQSFANRWYNEIMRELHSLANNPERCHKARENDRFGFDLYELLSGKRRHKHRILFRIHDNVVLVLHIRHTAQSDLE